jgi:hypothetical protein
VRVITVFALVLVAVATAASAASAAPTAGQTFAFSHSMANEGQIESPNDIGVDPSTGDVLVTSATGLQIYAPGAGPSDAPISTVPLSGLTSLEVAANGDVYAQVGGGGFGSQIVLLHRGPGAPPTYTQDPDFLVEANSGVRFAVDPSTGDLLVGQGFDVTRVSPAGDEISTFGSNFPSAIAATGDGTIFLFGFEESVRVRLLTPTGLLKGSFRIPAGPNGERNEVSGLSYDPINDVVDVAYPVEGRTHVVGLNSAGEVVYTFDYPGTEPTLGAAVDPGLGRFYGVSREPVGIQVFDAAVNPGIGLPEVSAITPTTAHLRAEVDPGSGPPAGSYAQFEYSADGGKTWIETAKKVGAAAAIEDDLTGLEPNFEYLVRAVAGTDLARHIGNPVSFKTAAVPPVVATLPANSISESGAALNGSVDPVRLPTSYRFEYGLSTAYGQTAPPSEPTAGSGSGARIFSAAVKGLSPGTTYHFRIVATNSSGQTAGEDLTFTTAAAGSELLRAFEQVTPVEKNGGSVLPNFSFQISDGTPQLSYSVLSPSGSLSSPLQARFLATRGDTGWSSVPTDPPLGTARITVFWLTLAISRDFKHSFVVSTRALAPGGIEGACNLYRVDMTTGAYSLVAATEEPGALTGFTGSGFAEKFMAGNADFSTILFASGRLLPGAPKGLALYRWSTTKGLELESALPGGAVPNNSQVLNLSSNYGGLFETASSDTRRSYFALSGGPAEAGVYLKEDGVTRAISVSRRTGDPATPQEGELFGVSRDGRYAFFDTYATQLTEDAPATPGNIYRYDAVEDTLEYIGQAYVGAQEKGSFAYDLSDNGMTFAFSDPVAGYEVWRDGQVKQAWPAQLGRGHVSMTPDGRYLAWDTAEGEGDVYLFNAVTGERTCVSCLPDGSESHAAGLPVNASLVSRQQPNPFADNGDLYFTSSAALVSGDVNGKKDVYEWTDGERRLMTPGNGPFDAYFAAVSGDERDLYFTTKQSLVRQDRDGTTDIYDARIGGGIPAQNAPPPQPCVGADCRTAGDETALGGPVGGSEQIRGSGNFKAKKHRRVCPKGKRAVKAKGKTRCVAPKAKKGKKHQRGDKRANHNRRQGR